MTSGPGTCLYATVKKVRVDAVTSTELTFSSRSSANKYESFTVALGEILVAPPTDAPLPVDLSPGAVGYLYLSKDGWKTTAKSGATLYKAGDESYVLFKWPLCKPYRLLSVLRVKPTKIVVAGEDLATGAAITLDLLGDAAAPAQDVDWNAAAPITVALSAAGAAAHGGRPTLQIWPRQIVVDAASLQKPHISASLDVLDVTYGDFNQRLTWTDRGAPIDLKLGSTGFHAFKVLPGPLVHYASGLAVTYPYEILAEVEKFADVTDEADVREVVERARTRGKQLPPRPADDE